MIDLALAAARGSVAAAGPGPWRRPEVTAFFAPDTVAGYMLWRGLSVP